MERKLYRNRKNQMIAGVCSGVAEYLDIDPTVIRALFAIFAVVGGGGVLLYIVLMIVIPLVPEKAAESVEIVSSESIAEEPKAAPETSAEASATVVVETQPTEKTEPQA
jgi:phage shock protein C